ncbi:MAG: hypothetical protein WD827_05830 [Solirubrobacterales bacterium]
MLTKRFKSIRDDERGMTLIELLVATLAGVIIFFGLTMIVIAAMHQTTRITNRVHTTQQARSALHRIITELHSSCVAPKVAPVIQGSTGTTLKFIHQTGSAVSPVPVMREISLSGTTLSESTYSVTGTTPKWTPTTTKLSTQTLRTRVSAISGSIPVFRYYAYSGGQISSTPLAVPLSSADAAKAVQVNVAFKVSAPGSSITDAKAAAHVEDSVLLRFTPPTFSTSASNLPCE